MMPTTARPLHELAAARRSTRAFLDRPVGREQLEALLATAALAPSTFNTQPWRVHVLAGEGLARLTQALLAADRAGAHPVFSPFPPSGGQACRAHQQDFGRRYYATLGIAWEDGPARARQTARNYAFFGAPAGLMLSVDRELTVHSWLDLGLFLQTLMLAACEAGLASCPQVAFLRYEDVIARELGFEPGERLACGLSLGWPDPDAPVNRMAMPRLAPRDFARWH